MFGVPSRTCLCLGWVAPHLAELGIQPTARLRGHPGREYPPGLPFSSSTIGSPPLCLVPGYAFVIWVHFSTRDKTLSKLRTRPRNVLYSKRKPRTCLWARLQGPVEKWRTARKTPASPVRAPPKSGSLGGLYLPTSLAWRGKTSPGKMGKPPRTTAKFPK